MALNTYPYSPFPASTEQLHKGDNEDLQAQIDAIKDGTNIDSFGDVETALEDKTDTAVIAPDFDAESGVYAVGDLVMYQGKLYEFTTAHETAGDWDPTEVTEKTVADEIDTVKSGLTNHGTYSTAPVKIGTWLGHDLYRKVIPLGALPDTAEKKVDSGLNNEFIVNLRVFAYNENNFLMLPYLVLGQTIDSSSISTRYDYTTHQVSVTAGSPRNNFDGYAVLEYYVSTP